MYQVGDISVNDDIFIIQRNIIYSCSDHIHNLCSATFSKMYIPTFKMSLSFNYSGKLSETTVNWKRGVQFYFESYFTARFMIYLNVVCMI